MPKMTSHSHHGDELSIISQLSAILLIAVVGFSYYYKPKQLNLEENMSQDFSELNVTGMTCSHCEANVKRAASEGKGVESVNIDLQSGQVLLKGKAIDTDGVIASINSLGYKANLVK
ncbi:MAG: heavy-metal-associated domain-containing protein [Candidatus Marinimicrobia bacterium]|nr:heavy-metal-associated domain-containing protein [Candidatus Neomarinimicrobiota bacterium]